MNKKYNNILWPYFWSQSPIRLLLFNRCLDLVRACPDRLKAIVDLIAISNSLIGDWDQKRALSIRLYFYWLNIDFVFDPSFKYIHT